MQHHVQRVLEIFFVRCFGLTVSSFHCISCQSWGGGVHTLKFDFGRDVPRGI